MQKVSEDNVLPQVLGLEKVEVINYFAVSHKGIFPNLYTFRTASTVREAKKVNESRKGPGVAQRDPGGSGSQIP
jgi:hypothetical protein